MGRRGGSRAHSLSSLAVIQPRKELSGRVCFSSRTPFAEGGLEPTCPTSKWSCWEPCRGHPPAALPAQRGASTASEPRETGSESYQCFFCLCQDGNKAASAPESFTASRPRPLRTCFWGHPVLAGALVGDLLWLATSLPPGHASAPRSWNIREPTGAFCASVNQSYLLWSFRCWSALAPTLHPCQNEAWVSGEAFCPHCSPVS